MKNYITVLITALGVLPFANTLCAQTINTLAGNGSVGFGGDGNMGTLGMLNAPFGVAADNQGNVYIADRFNNRIRKVDASGIMTTVAGNGSAAFSGDGSSATAASINAPTGVAVDTFGVIYIADRGNNRIRKVAAGIISTLAGSSTVGFSGDGGAASAAAINGPRGIAVDATGNVYFSDQGNNRIRIIYTTGTISTLAGNGTAGFGGDNGAATNAVLYNPAGIAIDSAGNVYIADVDNARIRKVNTTGIITTVAGNGIGGFSGDGGSATNAQLSEPIGVCIDRNNNLYIADGWNARIRKVIPTGIISTFAGIGSTGYSGDGGNATDAELNNPYGIAINRSGNLYIADYSNNRVRHINAATAAIAFPQERNSSIFVYPNPSSGIITITAPQKSNASITYSLTNMSGNVIGNYTANTNNQLTLPQEIPAGTYYLSAPDIPLSSGTTIVIVR